MPPSQSNHDAARAYFDTLTKRFASESCLCLRRRPRHHRRGRKRLSRAVTYQVVLSFLARGAAINVLARLHHRALTIVDLGVDLAMADLPDHPQLLRPKLTRGTANMLDHPALTPAELDLRVILQSLCHTDRALAHTITKSCCCFFRYPPALVP